MKNKWIAAILAFPGFLGWIGIHKFYLGENAGGVIYLLFSWTGIPAIFAIFDCLGLLMISEENFDRKYNASSILDSYSHKNSHLVSSDHITQTLLDLKNLYDQGVITAEEYEEKRKKLLNRLN
jgi:TM2 domain-containing membrane protein YozV